MKAHAALADEFGATPWWHGGGSVEWTAPEDRAAQQAKVERLQAWGYAAEWITPQQLLELEPDIDPGADRRCADRVLSPTRAGSIRWSTSLPCWAPRGRAVRR